MEYEETGVRKQWGLTLFKGPYLDAEPVTYVTLDFPCNTAVVAPPAPAADLKTVGLQLLRTGPRAPALVLTAPVALSGVVVAILSLDGRLLEMLDVPRTLEAGTFTFVMRTARLKADGSYVCRVTAGNRLVTARALTLR